MTTARNDRKGARRRDYATWIKPLPDAKRGASAEPHAVPHCGAGYARATAKVKAPRS
jgi:hypothetical protein